ncbi:hypothetical protein PAXINDRAFT_95165 [Paxillus involutus ATCC 200175]|nr:hypothetical protein PAXINDRAFT_95165 [Paxillus involutus ATCC 200175]
MSSSETESEPELATDALTSLAAFARVSATEQSQDDTDLKTVNWAVETLAALDFRVVRKDASLHGVIQECASTILSFLDRVLEQQELPGDSLWSVVTDVASIFKPSFLHLLFQYRRLFHIIAARDLRPGSAPPAIVCWVDVVLARLGDVSAFVAAGFHENHPDQTLPDVLKVQRQEDNLRAAIQLPDNWDMVASILSSERVSPAAKRLSMRLMLGQYILYPALSGGQRSVDNTLQQLLSAFAEFIKHSAGRVDEGLSVSEPSFQQLIHQERLTSAIAVSLFAAADIAQKSNVASVVVQGFRPQTMAAVMRLVRFILHSGEQLTRTTALVPREHLDAPTSVIIRWGVVPQWAWSVWLECQSLYADTIVCLTTTYMQHHRSSSGALLDAIHSMHVDCGSTSSFYQGAVISVMTELIFRFIGLLSPSPRPCQLPTSMVDVLSETCKLVSQWMDANTCGIRSSTGCCKGLVILFSYLAQTEQFVAVNDSVVGSLALMQESCIRAGWKAAQEDSNLRFLEALRQAFVQAKRQMLQNDLGQPGATSAEQLMQFLVIMISSGVDSLDQEVIVPFIDTVGDRVVESRLDNLSGLCEIFLVCLATVNRCKPGFSFGKASVASDCEAIWHIGRSGNSINLFVVSAFSLYITSVLPSVEPLTYLEALDHLLDVTLLICSHRYLSDDEPLGLIIIPTICDALSHLLKHNDDNTSAYIRTNPKLLALRNVLQSLRSNETSVNDRYFTLLKRSITSTATRLLDQMDSNRDGGAHVRIAASTISENPSGPGHDLMFCRLNGTSHLLFVPGTRE